MDAVSPDQFRGSTTPAGSGSDMVEVEAVVLSLDEPENRDE
jgi:hypothetical protein